MTPKVFGFVFCCCCFLHEQLKKKYYGSLTGMENIKSSIVEEQRKSGVRICTCKHVISRKHLSGERNGLET